MMTVSAVAKLIPRPPARVDNKKQKSFEQILKIVNLLLMQIG